MRELCHGTVALIPGLQTLLQIARNYYWWAAAAAAQLLAAAAAAVKF